MFFFNVYLRSLLFSNLQLAMFGDISSVSAYRKAPGKTSKSKQPEKLPTSKGVVKKSPKKAASPKMSKSPLVETEMKQAAATHNAVSERTPAVTEGQQSSSQSLRAQEDSDFETSSSASSSEVEHVKRPDVKTGFAKDGAWTTSASHFVVEAPPVIMENRDEDSDESSD